MKTFLILIIVFGITETLAKDRCEPDFAKDCFSAVHSDLDKVINSKKHNKNVTNDNYLENLCNAIDDALNCTADIIDVDCSEEEGKTRFDKWNMAFVRTYFELCDSPPPDDKIFLRALIGNLDCWNATHFFECFETNTGISNVSQLMATDINKKECDVLYKTFELCRVKHSEISNDFCTHNQTIEAVGVIHHLFDTFMSSSHCINFYTNGVKNRSVYFIPSILLFCYIFVKYIIYNI